MNVSRTLLALTACLAVAGGCTKKIDLTINNLSEVARTVQLSTPSGTTTVGTVGPGGGRLSTVLRVETKELPAQCHLAAGAGAEQTFAVTEDSPSKWWFRITKDGKLAGPYGKHDEHVEADQTIDVTVPAGRTTILK
jgi:hypothetical protein